MPAGFKVHKSNGQLTQKKFHKKIKEQRPSANARGYNYRWQQARLVFLSNYPLCKHCEQDGRVKPATVVDHIIPHKGDKVLFDDRANWQPLCKPCHDKKTATEDGGFGNYRG